MTRVTGRDGRATVGRPCQRHRLRRLDACCRTPRGRGRRRAVDAGDPRRGLALPVEGGESAPADGHARSNGRSSQGASPRHRPHPLRDPGAARDSRGSAVHHPLPRFRHPGGPPDECKRPGPPGADGAGCARVRGHAGSSRARPRSPVRCAVDAEPGGYDAVHARRRTGSRRAHRHAPQRHQGR